MKKGKLIFVTGLFGAGKTTLTAAAIKQIPDVGYVVSYTTRSPRPYEVHGEGEYLFVDMETYISAKSKSEKWDETIIDGIYYGNDVASINKELESGRNLILCVPPEVASIDKIGSIYNIKPILIWIDTDIETSNKRIIADGRPQRVHNILQSKERSEEIKKIVDSVFTPVSDDIEENKASFISLIKNLL